MKVYEVHYNNMEPYEDNWHDSECFYSTLEGAVKYLEEEQGLVSEERTGVKYNQETKKSERVTFLVWHYPKYVCSMGNIDCNDCPNWYLSDNYNGKEFNYGSEDEPEYDDYCNEHEMRFPYQDPEWTIIEHEVRE